MKGTPIAIIKFTFFLLIKYEFLPIEMLLFIIYWTSSGKTFETRFANSFSIKCPNAHKYTRKELVSMVDGDFYNFMLGWFEVLMRLGIDRQTPGKHNRGRGKTQIPVLFLWTSFKLYMLN